MRVAVVGGGAAGMATASRVKRLLRDKAEVVVFERDRWISFALCGTPYYVGFRVKHLEDLLHYPLSEFTEKRGIRVRLSTEVVEVDVENKRLRFQEKNGSSGWYEYDYLVLATGARPRIPGEWREFLDYENVFTLHSLDDAERIRSYIARNHVKHVVLVGDGYISYELAENIRQLGRAVTIVGKHEYPLSKAFDEDMKDPIISALESNGVQLRLGQPAKTFEVEGEKVRRAVLDNGDSIEADAFILAPGIAPETRLAEKAGIKIGETGAIWVNEYLQTNYAEVYAVGDSVETTDLVTGKRVWVPLAPTANKMGFVAGSNIAGAKVRFPGVVRTNVTSAFGVFLASTGLTEREASREGYEAVAAILEANTKAKYVGGGRKIVLKVIADAKTGRLLGAQAIGDETAFWRINIVATLLMKKATVWDLFFNDIGYMPLTNPVWDPLIIAARLLMRRLGLSPSKV